MGLDRMQRVLLTLIVLVAYICGLVIIVAVTPRLWRLKFDEGLFIGIAAADVLGGILAFAPIGITFALFNGAFGIKVLDFCCLWASSSPGCVRLFAVFAPVTREGHFSFHACLWGVIPSCSWLLLFTP